MATVKEPIAYDVHKAQDALSAIIGKPMIMTIRTRGKETVCEGKVLGAYANVFLCEYTVNDKIFKASYRYTDIFMNEISIVVKED